MATRTADVVVIGAGVNGAATAYHLARKGARDVLVVERAGIASGPTGASSSIVRQHYSHEVTAKMALDSLRFFQRFDELTGGHAEFKTVGNVIAAPPRSLATVTGVVAMQQRIGIRTEIIDLGRLHELEPDMRTDDLAGGAWEPDAGYADPVGTTAGMLQWAVAHGATAWLQTPVIRLVVRNERVVGVETSRGHVATERVVLAAGPWSIPLAAAAGTKLPVRASRHPVLVFQRKGRSRPEHIVFDLVNRMYLRPEGIDLILVGSLDIAHSEHDDDPDDFDHGATFDETSSWAAMLLDRYPEYEDVSVRRGWSGIYEFSPDWHHVIGELPTARGCFVVGGTSGHGFKLGPACGDVMSDLVLGRTPAYDLHEFRIERFEGGAPIKSKYADTIIG